MNFSKIKSLTIPNGKVKSISIGGVKVWEETPEQIQLPAPTISLSGDILTIVDNSGGLADMFNVYFEGVRLLTTTRTERDLRTLNLPVGTYTIYVTARANKGYQESEPSNIISYTRETSTILSGTWLWIENPVKIWEGQSPLYAQGVSQNIDFTSNGQSFTNITSNPLSNSDDGYMYYNNQMVYRWDNAYGNSWTNSDAYRKITFTTPQAVSERFYTWFTANATKQN